MRLPASYAGTRRAPGRPAVLTAPYAKAQVQKPKTEGLRRRQRVAVSIGANADSSSDGGLSSDDGLSSDNDSDSDSGAEGEITGGVRVDAAARLAASTGRLPLRVGIAGARKRSGPQLSKAEIERRCNCKSHDHAEAAANAAVNATILVKIEDGSKAAGEEDDEEEDEQDEDEEEEDDDDDGSSSSSSDSDDEDEEEEEDEDEDEDDKDIIIPILPAAAARIKRRALQGRRTRLRHLAPRVNTANASSSDFESVSSASDGESSQSSDDGASSSDEEGALPAAPAVSASAGVTVAIAANKIGVVGTIDFEASASNVALRFPHDETQSQSPRIAYMSTSHSASPCVIVTVSSVSLLAALALFAFRLRRRRSSNYAAIPTGHEASEDAEKGQVHQVFGHADVSTWFPSVSSDVANVPTKD